MQSDTCTWVFSGFNVNCCLMIVYESFINCSILVGYRYFIKGLNDVYSFWIVINLCLVQLVIIDECSQMTEPASLLPVSKFACEKLVLVGDPKVCKLDIVSSYNLCTCILSQYSIANLGFLQHLRQLM